jgi:aspartate carbamoyltransferase catalytic subunit
MPRPRRSLLGIQALAAEEIESLLRLARRMERTRSRPLLRGRRLALLFYESSTRTRVSFEFAAKALGADTSVVHALTSSVSKGESLIDTGYTLEAMGIDGLVIRHPSAGAPHLLARYLKVPVINAGDGMHEHPTQALLDAYTILRHRKRLQGLRAVIVGDIYHSRVARSNVWLWSKFGVHVTLCGPPELAPEAAASLAPGVRVVRQMEEALRGADVVMVLRVQRERLAGRRLKLREYVAAYQLTAARLRLAKRDALVMHPGPMIRGLELSDEVADSSQSVIRQQVASGVPVRMAVLATALGAAS